MKKFRIKVQTFSVYLSTTLVLLLLGAMCALLLYVRAFSRELREDVTISVVMNNAVDSTITEEDILSLKSEIEKREYIQSLEYLSSADIFEREKVAMQLDEEALEILGTNPFNASFEIKLKEQYANNDSIAVIETELLKNRCIGSIEYPAKHLETVNKGIRKVLYIMLILVAVLTLISWSLIANMMRLGIYSKRFLLHTMKLVGADWSFIRRPFLLQGLCIGLVSGILANILLFSAYYIYIKNMPATMALLSTEACALVACVVIIFGIIITVLCAYLSVNRFLRMRAGDLYFI